MLALGCTHDIQDGGSSAAAMYGNIVHELLQDALTHQAFTLDALQVNSK